MTQVFATALHDCFVQRWMAVDASTEIAIVCDLAYSVGRSGLWTAAPLREHPMFARLDYTEAVQVGGRFGATLLTRETFDRARRNAVARLEPFTLPADALMASFGRCLQHDKEVWRRINALGLPDDALIVGMGKHHIAGAPPGRCYLFGWWTEHLERYSKTRRGPGYVQQGAAPGSPGPHSAQQRDYATTTIIERPRAA